MGALPQLFLPSNNSLPLWVPPSHSLSKMRRSKPDGSPGSSIPPPASNKGLAWSEAEHVAFLNGLQAFGRGQWKQISRYYVPSRTPTQVASHAQKHFLRMSGANKRHSRFTTVEEKPLAAIPAAPRPPVKEIAGGPAASDADASSASGTSARLGAPMGPLPAGSLQFGGVPFTLPPPPDAHGVALGIPAPRPTPVIASPTGTLPMLRVHPGRINLNKKSSSQSLSVNHTTQTKSETKPRQHLRREAAVNRRVHLEQLRDLRERLRAEDDIVRRSRRCSHGSHHSSSTCSDTTSGPRTAALDALAGVAAALADSAGSPL